MRSTPLVPAHALLRTPSGEEHFLYVGELVGRIASAALLLDDPRVSEAHALLSIRRGRLVLLALRRLIVVGGHPMREVELRRGLDVELAPGLLLHVLEVHLAHDVFAVEAEGLGRRALGPATSLYAGTPPRSVGRFEPEADCHVWSLSEGWRVQRRGGAPEAALPGTEVQVGECTFRFVEMPAAKGHFPTRSGQFAPIRLVTFYDGVELHRAGHSVLTLGGLGARILSELAAFGGPVPWHLIASEIWPETKSNPEIDVRPRWDAALSRLRRQLRAADVRSDLVRSDRSGFVQLVLAEGDELEDRA